MSSSKPYTVFMYVLIVVVVLLLVYYITAKHVQRRRVERYGNIYPQTNPLNREHFHEFNPSIAQINGKVLIASRLDNRVKLAAAGLFWLPGDRFYLAPNNALVVIPNTQNYIVIRVRDTASAREGDWLTTHDVVSQTVLTLPVLPGMHPNWNWYEQYEDPRIFCHEKTGRVFVTATVFTATFVRLAVVELDPSHDFSFLRGCVMDRPESSTHTEKNWGIFTDGHGNDRMITDAYPQLEIYDFNIDTFLLSNHQTHDTTKILHRYNKKDFHIRCSAAPIPFTAKTMLVTLHVRQNMPDVAVLLRLIHYRTLFIEIENTAPYKPIRASRMFSFTNDNTRIEFAAGCSWESNERNTLLVSLGLDDVDNVVARVDPAKIFGEDETYLGTKLNDKLR
jgi:hypothetical protein